MGSAVTVGDNRGGGGVTIGSGILVKTGDKSARGDAGGDIDLWGGGKNECVGSGNAAVSVDMVESESSLAPLLPLSMSSWEVLSHIMGSILLPISGGEPPMDAIGDDGPGLEL